MWTVLLCVSVSGLWLGAPSPQCRYSYSTSTCPFPSYSHSNLGSCSLTTSPQTCPISLYPSPGFTIDASALTITMGVRGSQVISLYAYESKLVGNDGVGIEFPALNLATECQFSVDLRDFPPSLTANTGILTSDCGKNHLKTFSLVLPPDSDLIRSYKYSSSDVSDLDPASGAFIYQGTCLSDDTGVLDILLTVSDSVSPLVFYTQLHFGPFYLNSPPSFSTSHTAYRVYDSIPFTLTYSVTDAGTLPTDLTVSMGTIPFTYAWSGNDIMLTWDGNGLVLGVNALSFSVTDTGNPNDSSLSSIKSTIITFDLDYSGSFPSPQSPSSPWSVLTESGSYTSQITLDKQQTTMSFQSLTCGSLSLEPQTGTLYVSEVGMMDMYAQVCTVGVCTFHCDFELVDPNCETGGGSCMENRGISDLLLTVPPYILPFSPPYGHPNCVLTTPFQVSSAVTDISDILAVSPVSVSLDSDLSHFVLTVPVPNLVNTEAPGGGDYYEMRVGGSYRFAGFFFYVNVLEADTAPGFLPTLPVSVTIPASVPFTMDVSTYVQDSEQLVSDLTYLFSLPPQPSTVTTWFTSSGSLLTWVSPEVGSFSVSVSITDQCGNSISATISLDIVPKLDLNLPSLFTISLGDQVQIDIQDYIFLAGAPASPSDYTIVALYLYNKPSTAVTGIMQVIGTIITWTPTENVGSSGDFQVFLKLSTGLKTLKTVKIIVNRPVHIESLPLEKTYAVTGTTWTHTFTLHDWDYTDSHTCVVTSTANPGSYGGVLPMESSPLVLVWNTVPAVSALSEVHLKVECKEIATGWSPLVQTYEVDVRVVEPCVVQTTSNQEAFAGYDWSYSISLTPSISPSTLAVTLIPPYPVTLGYALINSDLKLAWRPESSDIGLTYTISIVCWDSSVPSLSDIYGSGSIVIDIKQAVSPTISMPGFPNFPLLISSTDWTNTITITVNPFVLPVSPSLYISDTGLTGLGLDPVSGPNQVIRWTAGGMNAWGVRDTGPAVIRVKDALGRMEELEISLFPNDECVCVPVGVVEIPYNAVTQTVGITVKDAHLTHLSIVSTDFPGVVSIHGTDKMLVTPPLVDPSPSTTPDTYSIRLQAGDSHPYNPQTCLLDISISMPSVNLPPIPLCPTVTHMDIGSVWVYGLGGSDEDVSTVQFEVGLVPGEGVIAVVGTDVEWNHPSLRFNEYTLSITMIDKWGVTGTCSVVLVPNSPSLCSAPVSIVLPEGHPWYYQLPFTDLSDPIESITVAVSVTPMVSPGPTVDIYQGVTWTPPDVHVNTAYTLTVDYTDPGNGHMDSCSILLDVQVVNLPPTILYSPPPGHFHQRKQIILTSGLTESIPYSYSFTVEDLDTLPSISSRIIYQADPLFSATFTHTDPTPTTREFTITWTPLNLMHSSGMVTIEIYDLTKPDNRDLMDIIYSNVVQIDDSPVLEPLIGSGSTYFDSDLYSEDLQWSDADSFIGDITVDLLFITSSGAESSVDVMGLEVVLIGKSTVIRLPHYIPVPVTGQFVVKVCDLSSCVREVATMDIKHVNQLPKFATSSMISVVSPNASGAVSVTVTDFEGDSIFFCLDSSITDPNDGQLSVVSPSSVQWSSMAYHSFTSYPFTLRITDRTSDCTASSSLFTSQPALFCRDFACNSYPQTDYLVYNSVNNEVTVHFSAPTTPSQVYFAGELTSCTSFPCPISGNYVEKQPIIVKNSAGFSVPLQDNVLIPVPVINIYQPNVIYANTNCEIVISGTNFLPSIRCFQVIIGINPLELYLDFISSTQIRCITGKLSPGDVFQLELQQTGKSAQTGSIRVCPEPFFTSPSVYTGESMGGYGLDIGVNLGCWDTNSVHLLYAGHILQAVPNSQIDSNGETIHVTVPPQDGQIAVTISVSTTPFPYIWSASTAQINYTTDCFTPGVYCPNAKTAVKCPVGHYCDTSFSTLLRPVPCPPGKYQDELGKNGCKDCPVGYMCDNEGLVAPVPCRSGFICDKSGISWPVILCPPGNYCQTGTNTRYIFPKEATFSVSQTYYTYETLFPLLSDPPSDHWLSRGQGFDSSRSDYYQSGGGFRQQEYCPGYYAPVVPGSGDALVQPIYCPDGSFCGSSVETNIPDNTDFKAPRDCTEGYICQSGDGESFDTRRLCSSGFYCPGVSGSSHQDCTFFPSNCRKCKCPPGSSCPFSGMNQPTLCSKGTYQDLCTTGTCKQCPSGYFCPTEGITSISEMTVCPPGNDCPLGSMKPIPCPTGTYKQLLGSNCVTCPVGFLCPEQGMTSPVICPAGLMCLFTGLLQGTQCPAGFYCPLGTNINQFPCPVSDIGQTCIGCEGVNPACHCPSCPVQCPAGSMCPVGSPLAIPCSPGFYQDLTGQSTCKTCVAGYFCPSTGVTAMTPCTPGYYCDQDGLIQPTALCPSGFVCPQGTIYGSPQSRRLSTGPIRDCVSANSSLKSGSPLYCPTGHYCPTGSSTSAPGVGGPVPCESGTFSQLCGQGSCSACPMGYSCSQDGTVDPSMCAVGYYSTGRSNVCDPCPIGTWGGTMLGKTQASDCPLCPAGYVCATEGISSVSNMRLCKPGFYCSSGCSIEINLCPAGYFCPSGTPSLSAAQSHPCPPGRFCAEGTSATQSDISSCSDSTSPCLIGKICPQNYFCPTGTDENYIPCPEDTISTSGSKAITDCYINPKVPPKVYKTINALFRDTAASWNYTETGLVIEPLTTYRFVFSRQAFQQAVFLVDYILVIELLDSTQTTRIPLITVEKYTPLQRIPLTISLLSPTDTSIQFSVLSHISGQIQFNVEILSGFYAYESFLTLFQNTVSLQSISTAQRKSGFSFLSTLNRASKDTYFEPINTGITHSIDTNPATYSTFSPKLVQSAVISLPTLPQSTLQANPQSQVSFWDLFSQSQNLYPLDYRPYISDCEGYGAYLAIYDLINSEKCSFVLPEDTIPVEILKVTTEPHGDNCDFSVKCRFSEDFAVTTDQNKEFWVGAYELSAYSVMGFTRPQLSTEEYRQAIPTESGTTSFDGKFYGSGDLIQVISSRGTESYERGMHPANVHLDLGYYQKTRIDKELLQAKLIFSSFSSSSDREYTFKFTLRALSWKDCLDLFGFEEALYYVFVFLLCLFIFTAVVLFWLANYSLSRIMPRPKLKIAIYLTYSGRAIFGIFLAVFPILVIVILLWIPLNTLTSLQSVTGDYAYTEPINPDSLSDLDKV